MGQWLPGFGCLNPGSLYSQLREQFDYLTEDQFDSNEFFKYKGHWYDVGEFMRLENNSPFGKQWDGYSSDTLFQRNSIKVLLRWHCYCGHVL
jgi:hypothetical protein